MKIDRTALAYRADLDGLRGIAIALVLAYHVAPSIVPGGFVGVDVFFVLSGYLITRILLSSPPSLARFYSHRARRLLPALLLVLVTTLLISRVTVLSPVFRQHAEHALAAVLFLANIAFWRESGYFDASAIDKPLLHLWSLGVEEQFYLFWPLVLWWCLLRLGDKTRPVTAALAGASFVGCLWMVQSSPESAFYLPWFRFWEPFAGALLALYARPRKTSSDAESSDRPKTGTSSRFEVIAGAAALAIVASAFWLDRTSPFPSWTALAPVLGTVALIAIGERSTAVRLLLTRPTMVGLGRISYPLYLWHWPLISLLADPHPQKGLASRTLLCAAAVVLSVATYRWIEKPTRALHARRPTLTLTVLTTALLVVGGLSFHWLRAPIDTADASRVVSEKLAVLEAGFRLDRKLRKGLDARDCGDLAGLPTTNIEFVCRVTGSKSIERPLVLWGDSSADSWAPLVQTVARDRGQDSVVLSVSGCPPLFGVRGPLHAHCDLGDEAWKLQWLRDLEPSHIVISARWGAYAEVTLLERPDLHYVTTAAEGPADREASRQALAQTLGPTLEELANIAPVTILGAAPDLLGLLPRARVFDLEIRQTKQEHRLSQQFFWDLLEQSPLMGSRVTLIDPSVKLCASGRCEAIFDGTVVYQDDNHVSAQGALLFRDLLEKRLDELASTE